MRNKKLWLVLVVCFLIVPAVVMSASAEESVPQAQQQTVGQNEVVSSGVSPSDVDPLIWDAQMYASNMGVSLEEALLRFKLQDIAGELDAKLEVGEAKRFAGLWIEHTPKFRVIVQFVGEAEGIITPYLVPELADIVEVRSAQVSLADLQKAQSEVLAAVKDLGIPVESGINLPQNRVELYVADRARLDEALESGAVRLPGSVAVITVEAMGNPDVDIYGGLPLSTCTSGFSVRRSSDGTKGITTAAHCSNSQSYNGVSLTFRSEQFTGSYDVQWHTKSGYTVRNIIRWWKDGSTRSITATKSRSSQTVGGYVCKYGKTTYYTCGYISDKYYRPSYVPNASATFIRVDNTAGYGDLSSGGDSGGPWFLTNTAYGTHSGSPGADPNDAIYMAINYVSGLGVSVMTSP